MSTTRASDDQKKDSGIEGLRMSVDYGIHASTAKACILQSSDIALRAVESVLSFRRSATEPFVVSDWGCADGINSLALFNKIFHFIRKADAKIPLGMIYFDNSHELANQIDKALNGHPESYRGIAHDLDVSVRCIQDSFYRNALPASGVDFIFSSIAMHWSSRNVVCETHIYNRFGTSREREQAAQLATEDWDTLLSNLSSALRPGGQAVLVNLTTIEKAEAFDHTAKEIYNAIWQIAKEQNADGFVSLEKLRELSFGMYHRTAKEFELPFIGSERRDPKSGLKIEESNICEIPCTYFERYGNSDATDRAVTFGADLANAARGWSESTVRNALGDKSAKKLYQRLADIIASDPKRYQMPFIIHQMRLSKDG